MMCRSPRPTGEAERSWYEHNSNQVLTRERPFASITAHLSILLPSPMLHGPETPENAFRKVGILSKKAKKYRAPRSIGLELPSQHQQRKLAILTAVHQPKILQG